jgi:DNA repair protein RadC
MNTYSNDEQRVINLLSRFFPENAAKLYESHDRSLQRVMGFVRDSALPASVDLAAGLEIARELLGEELRARPVFESPATVKSYLKLQFAGQAHESFVVLFLDAQHRLIAAEELFRGTLTSTAVHPREIVKRALHYNAAAILAAHPHPSGQKAASAADRALTSMLKSSLALIEVSLLDHFIVAGSEVLSFAEQGLM